MNNFPHTRATVHSEKTRWYRSDEKLFRIYFLFVSVLFLFAFSVSIIVPNDGLASDSIYTQMKSAPGFWLLPATSFLFGSALVYAAVKNYGFKSQEGVWLFVVAFLFVLVSSARLTPEAVHLTLSGILSFAVLSTIIAVEAFQKNNRSLTTRIAVLAVSHLTAVVLALMHHLQKMYLALAACYLIIGQTVYHVLQIS